MREANSKSLHIYWRGLKNNDMKREMRKHGILGGKKSVELTRGTKRWAEEGQKSCTDFTKEEEERPDAAQSLKFTT